MDTHDLDWVSFDEPEPLPPPAPSPLTKLQRIRKYFIDWVVFRFLVNYVSGALALNIMLSKFGYENSKFLSWTFFMPGIACYFVRLAILDVVSSTQLSIPAVFQYQSLRYRPASMRSPEMNFYLKRLFFWLAWVLVSLTILLRIVVSSWHGVLPFLAALGVVFGLVLILLLPHQLRDFIWTTPAPTNDRSRFAKLVTWPMGRLIIVLVVAGTILPQVTQEFGGGYPQFVQVVLNSGARSYWSGHLVNVDSTGRKVSGQGQQVWHGDGLYIFRMNNGNYMGMYDWAVYEVKPIEGRFALP